MGRKDTRAGKGEEQGCTGRDTGGPESQAKDMKLGGELLVSTSCLEKYRKGQGWKTVKTG